MRYKRFYLEPEIHTIVTVWRPEGIMFIEDIDKYIADRNYTNKDDINFVHEPSNDIYVVLNHRDMSSTLLIPETSKYFNFDFMQQRMSAIKQLAQNAKDFKSALFYLKAVEQRLSHIANKVLATLG